MKFLNKLERRFGKYAIPNLINYFLIASIFGAVLGVLAPGLYGRYLMLDPGKVMQGQVWRLVTFLLEPYFTLNGGASLLNILFFLILLHLYQLFGRSLENAWGTFRFNLYFLSGILLNIIAAFILYFAARLPYVGEGLNYIYNTMFFAFAAIYPDVQFNVFFMIPIKVKWLAILDGGLLLIQTVQYLIAGFLGDPFGFVYTLTIAVAMANFLFFFFATRNYKRMSPKEHRRRRRYRRQVREAQAAARHRCTICGRTNEDDESLEFRFCSKCDGSYEYCMEHLFTHEHIKKH